MRHKHKYITWMVTAALLTVAASLAAICMGQFHIPVGRVVQEIFRPSLSEGIRDNVKTTIFNIRIPRILMSLMSGAALASSGAAFQSLFANPLATPDTLGVANGASFGAALALLLGGNAFEVKGLSLLFGLAAIVLVFAVTRGMGQRNPSLLMVILAGMVISSLFSALVSLIKYVADPQDVLPVITFWLMGRFSGITRNSMLFSAPLMGAGILLIYLLRFRL
nr:iron ABC transporter permease [Lachnospiraceae bacterium]